MKAMIGTGATILVADQATKWYILGPLALDQRLFVPVLDPYVNFVMAWNTGINFGLFGSESDAMRWVLIALALAICGFVLVWLKREGAPRNMQIATGFLIGGAIGNVIDRIRFGAVADFLNVTCCGFRNPYAFNIADISIFLGAALLILFAGPRESARRK
ncbi:MAG: lipoprotein signal peptidase LspA [Roseibaca calidilacus]|uniref:Lipoprotein signal peptidase n=1 Tax=Roseibaca calidilacus TaxID=1666912 RepID=A0A0P7W175_9RHOB|nr:signal peptidase II [Roseibaca calidilacus]KPP93592.1 MAG: lipoprotein signal peptidase LspA [Roseibaca calidilacus]CUX80401.1 signal peptidase II [Roseibaca calidilacus]